MKDETIRGVSKEVNRKDLLRSTEKKPIYKNIIDNKFYFQIGLIIITAVAPEAFFVTLPVILLLSILGSDENKDRVLPFFMPKSSRLIDQNEIHPGTGKPVEAEGVAFFGNSIESDDEIWFTDSNIRTHTLVFGTTGAGKTELLISICQNALNQASGFIYTDGKGDSSLFSKIYSLVRRMGRDDDLLIINYMTGGLNKKEKTEYIVSNTMNPFAVGNADELTELIVSLLPDGGGDAMWKGRAAIFMGSLMRVLVALRDDNKLLLDVNIIRGYFLFDTLVNICYNRKDILDSDKEGLLDYLINLPGFIEPTDKNPNPEQEFDVRQQHGFITMQYTEVFGLLADQYSHIMKTQLGEVDFFDVVVNRRILGVLLPALEKAQQSLSNLGKIIVSSTRQMMSTSLGGRLEGTAHEVIKSKPTNAPSAYITIFDEYGYYAVAGAAVMPAQARSLNFGMIFAGQDYQAFKKGSAEEAASIVANCGIKICMKLEDPTETFEIFQKGAGRAIEEKISGKEVVKGGMSKNYKDSSNITYEERDIIDILDLKKQTNGEAHILFGNKLVRMKSFFANPEEAKDFYLNHFLGVKPPSYESIKLLKFGFHKLKKQFKNLTTESGAQTFKENIKKAFDVNGLKDEFETIMFAIRFSRRFHEDIDKAKNGILILGSFIEKVEFIDEKIILGMKNNFEDIEKKKDELEKRNNFSDKPVPVEKEPAIIPSKKKAKPDSRDDDSFRSIEISKRIERNILEKQSILKKKGVDTAKTFESMGIFNIPELVSNINEIENAAVSIFKENNMLEKEEQYDEEYVSAVSNKIITDIGFSASYKESATEKKDKHKIMDKILEDIVIEDIS